MKADFEASGEWKALKPPLVGMVTVPVQDVWTDGRTDNRPVPSLRRAVPEHAVPSPDGSEDGRPVHRKTEDGRRILLRTDPPDVVLSLLAAAALHHITAAAKLFALVLAPMINVLILVMLLAPQLGCGLAPLSLLESLGAILLLVYHLVALGIICLYFVPRHAWPWPINFLLQRLVGRRRIKLDIDSLGNKRPSRPPSRPVKGYEEVSATVPSTDGPLDGRLCTVRRPGRTVTIPNPWVTSGSLVAQEVVGDTSRVQMLLANGVSDLHQCSRQHPDLEGGGLVTDSLSHRRYSDHANTPELEMLDPLDSMETLKKTSASESERPAFPAGSNQNSMNPQGFYTPGFNPYFPIPYLPPGYPPLGGPYFNPWYQGLNAQYPLPHNLVPPPFSPGSHSYPPPAPAAPLAAPAVPSGAPFAAPTDLPVPAVDALKNESIQPTTVQYSATIHDHAADSSANGEENLIWKRKIDRDLAHQRLLMLVSPCRRCGGALDRAPKARGLGGLFYLQFSHFDCSL
ncbi:hypothetical protein B0H14DRAFT_3484673 [Mycena olivaceomarginata]|nr:hypothetical protein B0H14DRAFT_3484673 [Mycena olivaceomarginata]